MNRFIYTSLFILSICYPQDPIVPEGDRLRNIIENLGYENNILIGGTTGAWAFGTDTGTILDREFNYVTPENDFKQRFIYPDNNSMFNWVQTDLWIQHIEENDQILRMHCPIGPQCSSWAKEDNRTSEELTQNLISFISGICERYNHNERIISMDVVNETVHNGIWKGDLEGTDLWENPWVKIGYDNDINSTPLYISMAFSLADSLCPNIKLIYNQHGSLIDDLDDWELIKETVLYLREKGLRVDGIGWQAHVNYDWNDNLNGDITPYNELVEWSHSNNLEFHITEASVWIDDNSENSFEIQADVYSTILLNLLDYHNTGIVGWNTWHIDDGHGWQADRYPSLFDNNYIAKPAYYSIQSVLNNIQINGDVNNDGEVNIIDITQSISLILNNQFNEFVDVNNDNMLNIIDIVLLVNIILN